MNHSKPTIHAVDRLINNHAQYSNTDGAYSLDYTAIPDSYLEEISGHLITDEELCNEATGLDNPKFSTKMQPALAAFMRNPHDKDTQYDFHQAWREGIRTYFKTIITNLIDWRLDVHNHFSREDVA